MSLRDVIPTAHAVERFQERFAGNLDWERATERLLRLLYRSRFIGVCPGKAKKYALGGMRFIVEAEVVVTVYRQRRKCPPSQEDLWNLVA